MLQNCKCLLQNCNKHSDFGIGIIHPLCKGMLHLFLAPFFICKINFGEPLGDFL